MRVIAKRTLREFWEKHADSEQSLKSWFHETGNAQWRSPNNLKRDYPCASILEDNRVVFNIKGNKYRLIAKINYEFQIIWIRFIGSHADYDKIDVTKV